MRLRPSFVYCSRFVLVAATLGSSSLSAQVCIDDTCFIDRNSTGQIVLGNIRGALAAIDFDADGWVDLVVNDIAGQPDRLFHNVPHPTLPGNRTFVNVANSGLGDADGLNRGHGAAIVADYDNDGDDDVFFSGYPSADNTYGLLYRNNADGTLTNVSVTSGVRGSGNAVESASWVDFDLDGDVDLFLANNGFSARAFVLLRNNGDGTFGDASSLVPAFSVPGHTYSHLWMDYDGDGWSDGIMISNYAAPVILRNSGDGRGGRTFVNVGQQVGYTYLGPAPMGVAAGDYDNDGDFDLAITDAVDGTYYENLGDGTMVEVFPFGTFFGWGTMFIDVDNDGDVDNYQAGSWAAANPDQLFRNDGGTWTNVSAALNAQSLSSQYSIQIDFNNDGRPDIITVNPGTPGQSIGVYDNISSTGNNWINLELRGDAVDVSRNALGAVVRVFSGASYQVRQVVSGSSTTATEDLRQHFGLGAAMGINRIEVLWPRHGSLLERTDVYPGTSAINQFQLLSPKQPGDVNADAVVNIDDLLGIINNWGATSTAEPGGANIADANHSGSVDIDDLLMAINNWGT